MYRMNLCRHHFRDKTTCSCIERVPLLLPLSTAGPTNLYLGVDQPLSLLDITLLDLSFSLFPLIWGWCATEVRPMTCINPASASSIYPFFGDHGCNIALTMSLLLLVFKTMSSRNSWVSTAACYYCMMCLEVPGFAPIRGGCIKFWTPHIICFGWIFLLDSSPPTSNEISVLPHEPRELE